MNGKRQVRSLPGRLYSRTRLPSFRAITRKPSCLISCSHSSPEGGCGAGEGRHGAMKPASRARERNDMLGVSRTVADVSRIAISAQGCCTGFEAPSWQCQPEDQVERARRRAYALACPELAKADMRPFWRGSAFT
jgi:hypothetical protein